MPKVYNPQEKPWLKITNASTQELIEQLALCPSRALSIKNLGQ
ncbi:(4Fe-4S)-binding protein [Antarcticibacterium sp. 1MA-6-2]|nr:(4Fe-4S)-binding protein [Antarcticibacterium sp. 1MA-6-2]